jgi:thiol-disulfide isomerase/thioredoxin
MKKSIFFPLLLITCVGYAQTFKVTLQSNFKSGIAYLAHYMGGSLNVDDSTEVNTQGLAIFQGNKKLPPGIYAIVFPGKRHIVDFFIGEEQELRIEADSINLLQMKVSGSKEQELFYAYQQFVASKGKQLNEARQAYNNAKNAADSALQEQNFVRHNGELNAYRATIIETQPQSMLSTILKAMREPVLPSKVAVTRQDSVDNYQFYKAHFWDGISFMDDCVVRTPFFKTKLERYYRDLMPQAPDSIIKDADYKLLLARSSPEMYKYLLNWLTDEYINPKYMGQDAIFVHLFNKYHSKGVSSWLNENQMDAITKRAYMLMSNLVGEPAANLELLDTANNVAPLYNIKAAYTIVAFWDPNCGHCKEEIPRLDSFYRAIWKQKNIKVYAVMTEYDTDAWKAFINKHQLAEWTHVHHTLKMVKEDAEAQRPSFKQLYDITQTPTLYLLDKDKRILAKKLTLEQLNDFLKVKLNDSDSK